MLAAFILSVLMIDKLPPTTLGSVAISAVPVAAFSWFIVTAVRDIRRLDELQRRIQLEAVSRQTVNAIETEKYDLSLPLALRIAKLFTLPVEHIFDMEEP